jgi:hypothetical protein
MLLRQEEHRVREYIRDWKQKNKEMWDLLNMVEDSLPQMSRWQKMILGRTKMHGLLKKNEALLEDAEKGWNEKELNFFDDKSKQFNNNREDFMRLYRKWDKNFHPKPAKTQPKSSA